MFEIKDELTLENVLKKIDEYSIFKAYCKPFKELDKSFSSELRTDPKPSCRIIYRGGRLIYKDFGEEGSLDCFGYIMKKYQMTFRQALGAVNTDFNLGLQQELARPSLNFFGFEDKVKLIEKKEAEIKVKYRQWNKADVKFWREGFKIELETLQLYKTRPIQWMFVNDKFITAPKQSYASLIDVENSKSIYKIYSPFDEFKWLTNCKSHHYLGYSQLPRIGELLIITKSLKDVMELYQMGYNSIAPQSESRQIKDGFMELLRKRFNRIIVFFDNDNAGRLGAEKITSKHSIENIIIPVDTGCKDISDYVKLHGLYQGKQLVTQLIT